MVKSTEPLQHGKQPCLEGCFAFSKGNQEHNNVLLLFFQNTQVNNILHKNNSL